MKLVHLDYVFQIEFQEGIIHRLIVESPTVMSEFIVEFKRQIDNKDGKWILSHDGKILNISDNCDLIISIFDLEINQRKMLNVLYDELIHEINDTELLLDWRTISSNLERFLNQAVVQTGYSISYSELELKTILKAMEVKFQDGIEDYTEYLLEYLQLMFEVRKIQLFIMVNITSFLSKTDLEYLYEQVAYKKYHLLLLDVQNISVNKNVERTIIVDKDYCVIELDVT